ncbi:MAG: hypothetical protein KIT69_15680, partial [Propionibacteriaceae bacterium]|nr:hypothetical protein [Propionibacteriaceae bacterium]
MTTITTRTPRRAVVAIAALLTLVAGALVPTASDAATKYPYKAPPSVAVANVGKDYAEIVFGTVTGAPTYTLEIATSETFGASIVYSTDLTLYYHVLPLANAL